MKRQVFDRLKRANYNPGMLSRRRALAILAMPALRAQDPGPRMFADAQAYERFMGRWSRLAASLLVDFTDIPDTGRILDVGSGTGSLAFVIAERKTGVQVVGIDPSKEYVAYANRRNTFGERASFQVGDAQQLPFPDHTFQSSVSLFVFNYIPDAVKALREVRRVTRPGGRISAAVWDYGAGMRMLRFFWDAVASIDAAAAKLDQRHMPLCRAGELSQLWRKGGLDAIQEQPLDITMRFESFSDYWDAFLLGQGPAGAYVRTLDGNRRAALRAEVKRRMPVAAEDRPLALPARAWAVRGSVPN